MFESANLRLDPATDPTVALLATVDWPVVQSRPGFQSSAALGSSLERDPGPVSVAWGELIAHRGRLPLGRCLTIPRDALAPNTRLSPMFVSPARRCAQQFSCSRAVRDIKQNR
jgi:hypothetical protein